MYQTEKKHYQYQQLSHKDKRMIYCKSIMNKTLYKHDFIKYPKQHKNQHEKQIFKVINTTHIDIPNVKIMDSQLVFIGTNLGIILLCISYIF